jgi:hypothetical protein
MKRLSIVLLLSLISTGFTRGAHALVRVNHGPAFKLRLHPTSRHRVSQKGMLARYVLWNAKHEWENRALRARLRKTATEFADRPFILPHTDLTDNFLSFGYKNDKGIYHDWDFVRTEFGYCQGMTMVTRNFAYFAKFDPTAPEPVDYSEDPGAWLAFYERLVDRIMRNHVTVIPGFAGLPDFSRSAIAEYLHRHAADQWALNTARVATYEHIYKRHFKPIADRAELEALRARIAYFHAHGFYPRVVLGSQRYTVNDPHVVMLTKLLPPKDPADTCVSFEFFNVGMDAGGHVDALQFCVGDRVWIPDDEDLYLYDFANEILAEPQI